MTWKCLCAFLLLGALLPLQAVARGSQAETADESERLVEYLVRPSDTDAAIHLYNDPHYVVFTRGARLDTQLVLFMPGTGGRPTNARCLLTTIAAQGYRVIGLEYNDSPAVTDVCQTSLSVSCSGDLRRRRIFGGDITSHVEHASAESIVNRLVKLLEYLDREHPQEGWSRYLNQGSPAWPHVVVSGLSQGAGMAAYIAKHVSVARVVLFSSPWDYVRTPQSLAPWLAEPSATTPERWFAEYHRRENTAALIARAYEVLHIPPGNIRVFDLPAGPAAHGSNPFHTSTILVPEYAPQWRFLFGQTPPPGAGR